MFNSTKIFDNEAGETKLSSKFLVQQKKIDFVNRNELWVVSPEIPSSVPQSTSNGYLARFWQILPESCKIMHNLARFLPESCKITIHSARNLQDNHFSARNLQDNHFSARILQDNHFSARILQDSSFLPESCKIIISLSESSNISTFLQKILQEELINASNSDSKRFARKLF